MDSPSNLKNSYGYWEITKDLIDQCIDITLNLSQSGHPGGSRSKVHGMLITLLSGAMRWDIRVFSFILEITEVNVLKTMNWFVEKDITILQLRKKLEHEMIENEYIKDEASSGDGRR